MPEKLVVAFSGGKDSTALALRLHEKGIPFDLLYTPTGNELPGVRSHIDAVAQYTGARLIMPEAPTLVELITENRCLPNWRMRFCTPAIKIDHTGVPKRWLSLEARLGSSPSELSA